jgi:hypothetical protein
MKNFDNIIVLPFAKANFCVDAFAFTNTYVGTPEGTPDTLEVAVFCNTHDNSLSVATYEVPLEDFEGYLRHTGQLKTLVPATREEYDEVHFTLADWKEITDTNLQYDAVSDFLQSEVFDFADAVQKEIASVNKIKKEDMAIFNNPDTLYAYWNNQIATLQTALDIAELQWRKKIQI